MNRIQLTVLLLLLSAVAWSQDDATTEDDSATTEEAAVEDEIDEEVTDEEIEALLGLDEDYAEVEDDDFDPTESVRFEQSIPFPADI